MAKKKSADHATTQRELARLVGVSPSTVRDWLRHALWCFGPKGPWPVEHVKAWSEICVPFYRDTKSGALDADTREAMARTKLEMERLKLDEMKGLLVPADAVQALAYDMGRWLKTEVIDLFKRLPGLLGGKDPAEMRADLETEKYRFIEGLTAKVKPS